MIALLLAALVVLVVLSLRAPRTYERECVRCFRGCEFTTHIPQDDWRGREPRICRDCHEKVERLMSEDAVA